MKKWFFAIFSLIIILQSDFLLAQEIGMPFVHNYTIEDYDANIQNWSTVKDQRGVIYIANISCILEYDGVEWRKIKNKTETYIRCLNIAPSGRIYVGSVGDIGYLAPDSVGQMEYY